MILPADINSWPAEYKFRLEERAALIAESDRRILELDKTKHDHTGLRRVAEMRAEQEVRKQALEER